MDTGTGVLRGFSAGVSPPIFWPTCEQAAIMVSSTSLMSPKELESSVDSVSFRCRGNAIGADGGLDGGRYVMDFPLNPGGGAGDLRLPSGVAEMHSERLDGVGDDSIGSEGWSAVGKKESRDG